MNVAIGFEADPDVYKYCIIIGRELQARFDYHLLMGTPNEIRESNNEVVQQFIAGNAEGPITTQNHATH